MMQKFEIWDANVKYQDSNEVKTRPVLIASSTVYVITAYKITSTNRGDRGLEMRIEHWKEAGLDHESFVRLDPILRLEKKDFKRKRGELDDRDKLKLMKRFSGL